MYVYVACVSECCGSVCCASQLPCKCWLFLLRLIMHGTNIKLKSFSVCTTSVGAQVPIRSLSWTLPGEKRPQREADHTSHTVHTFRLHLTYTPPCLLGKVFRHNENFILPYPVGHILRRDTWQFIQCKLSSLIWAALACKRDEEPGHAATRIITLCIYQTIRQSIIINLPSSRELACFIFLRARNL
jgi:hypothetical protein